MLPSTTKPNAEQLNIQNNVEENQNRETSFEVQTCDMIPGSPFGIITTMDGAFLAMGQHRLSDIMKSKEEVFKFIDENHWDLILQVTAIVVEKWEDIKQFKNQK